ncbi:MAG: outer membrane protein assembly factor [bacterium]
MPTPSKCGLLLLIVGAVALPWTVGAEGATRVRSIEVHGNRFLPERDILRAMSLVPGQAYSPDLLRQDMAKILQIYRDAGYMMAEVSPPDFRYGEDSSQVTIFLQIDEGPELKVGTIEIVGNGHFNEEQILDMFDTRPEGSFRDGVLERDIEGLLRAYEESGFPFCRIEPGRFRIGEGPTIDLLLNIVEGPRVWVGEVAVRGNATTRDYVILRETKLRKGEVYKQSKIEAAQERLERMGTFSKVSPVAVEPAGRDTVNLLIQVEEGKTSKINGLLGYSPPQGDHKGYVTGLIDLSFANLLGTGRRVDVRWHHRDPSSSDLAFGYEEPWILGTPLGVGLSLEQIDQDSTYVLTQAGLAIGAPLGDNLSVSLRLGWERVVPDSTGGAFMARSTKYTAGVQAAFDTRDTPWNPRRGLYYRTSAEYGRKRNRATFHFSPQRVKVRTSKFTLDLEHFVPTFPRQVVAVALHGREFQSGERPVPLSEQFRLGGATTLRGYREDQFTGTRVAWSNFEYRYLLTSKSRAFLFFDLGTYFREQPDPDAATLEQIDKRKFGYGVGLRLESKLGVVGIDFALGEGDSFNQAKIHFRMENRF